MTIRIGCLGNLVGSPLPLSFQSTSKLRPPLRTCVLPDCLVFPCPLPWGCCSHTASWSLWPRKVVRLQGLCWQEWLSSKWSAQRKREWAKLRMGPGWRAPGPYLVPGIFQKWHPQQRKCPKIAQAANASLKPEKELLNSKIWVAVGVRSKCRFVGSRNSSHKLRRHMKSPGSWPVFSFSTCLSWCQCQKASLCWDRAGKRS